MQWHELPSEKTWVCGPNWRIEMLVAWLSLPGVRCEVVWALLSAGYRSLYKNLHRFLFEIIMSLYFHIYQYSNFVHTPLFIITFWWKEKFIYMDFHRFDNFNSTVTTHTNMWNNSGDVKIWNWTRWSVSRWSAHIRMHAHSYSFVQE